MAAMGQQCLADREPLRSNTPAGCFKLRADSIEA
jgi:hypothetical protein